MHHSEEYHEIYEDFRDIDVHNLCEQSWSCLIVVTAFLEIFPDALADSHNIERLCEQSWICLIVVSAFREVS